MQSARCSSKKSEFNVRPWTGNCSIGPVHFGNDTNYTVKLHNIRENYLNLRKYKIFDRDVLIIKYSRRVGAIHIIMCRYNELEKLSYIKRI